ncbi:MAG: hypothetical protein F4X17_01740 [Gemmatimonadetes bacterium]|nr:hypothetical protein [Gemmatimonadota bacterium]
MPGTAVTTRTKIEMQEDYEDFTSAWAVVCKRVDEFVEDHPGARITIDDSGGWALLISVRAGR